MEVSHRTSLSSYFDLPVAAKAVLLVTQASVDLLELVHLLPRIDLALLVFVGPDLCLDGSALPV